MSKRRTPAPDEKPDAQPDMNPEDAIRRALNVKRPPEGWPWNNRKPKPKKK